MNEVNIKTWAGKFLAGDFDAIDRDTQCDAGWYDWFCKETSLAGKTQKLGKKVVQLMKSDKIDTETMYVWFKNNCPMVGSLYDDFRIADIESGDVVFTIVPSSGFTKTKGVAQVFGRENNFKEPLAEGSWKDIKAYFGV